MREQHPQTENKPRMAYALMTTMTTRFKKYSIQPLHYFLILI